MRNASRLGPFTGGQLTLIIVALIVVLLFPATAWATYSVAHVTITDNGGTHVANVDAKHNVNTAIHDASTGAGAKVSSAGQLSVGAAPVAPNAPFYALFNLPQLVEQVLTQPSHSQVALTRIQMMNFFANTVPAMVVVGIHDGATACNAAYKYIGSYVTDPGTIVDNPGSPIVLQPLAPGHVWCLVATAYLKTSPVSYTPPQLAVSGYVTSGSALTFINSESPRLPKP